MNARLLLIDDDPMAGKLLRAVFDGENVEVATADTAESGLQAVMQVDPQVVVLDLHLPDMNGLEVLTRLQQRWPDLPVIMLTGRVDVKTAVRAMQLGAYHYLNKPIEPEEIVVIVQRALERRSLLREVEGLRRQVMPAAALQARMGQSAAVMQVIDQVCIVAQSELTVLIEGETGTGKELVAQAIHQQSARSQRPLVAVDCGAIPETLIESELFGHEKGAFTGADRRRHGRFQLAHGGTLFLDEAGNLPPSLQPKLLRVLESRELHMLGAAQGAPVDVRIVAATNHDLQAQVRQGRFREDLYFRLAQFTLRLPPLRERREDISYLVRRFAGEICLELKRPILEITPPALERLQAHRWPGNVRELRNVVRQAVVRCQNLSLDEPLIAPLIRQPEQQPAIDSPMAPVAGHSLREIAEHAAGRAERQAICAVLREVRGNKTVAAKRLQTDYKTLHVKIRRYAIAPGDYA